jgi:ribonuclease G
MSLELIVDARREETRFALMREGKLIELHTEKSSGEYVVGDIYLGKVKKVASSLNAAFINVGYEKDGFLHYLDVGPQFNSLNKFLKDTLNNKQKVADMLYFQSERDIPKDGKIDEIVSHGQPILVQVAKEPISSKGPRLNSEITLAGRYIVLVPFSDKI